MVPNRAQLLQHIFGVNDKAGDETDAAKVSQEQERIDQIAERFLQVLRRTPVLPKRRKSHDLSKFFK
jgi:hypothetical protein